LSYKSSGLSETGHTGLYIPFSHINISSIDIVPGYIFKEYLYNGRILNHRKTINSETNEKVKLIANFIESQDIEPKKCNYEIFSYLDTINFITEVTEDMDKILKNKKLFDYKLDDI